MALTEPAVTWQNLWRGTVAVTGARTDVSGMSGGVSGIWVSCQGLVPAWWHDVFNSY